MLSEIAHFKITAIMGLMMGIIHARREYLVIRKAEPNFHDDPVPGDTFPYYIFDRVERNI